MAELSPKTQLYTVEPAGFDDTRRSMAEGARVVNDPAARSFCDALLVPTPGELTFPINRRLLAGGFVVSDDEARAAMSFRVSDLETGDRAGRCGRFGGLALGPPGRARQDCGPDPIWRQRRCGNFSRDAGGGGFRPDLIAARPRTRQLSSAPRGRLVEARAVGSGCGGSRFNRPRGRYLGLQPAQRADQLRTRFHGQRLVGDVARHLRGLG